MAEVLQVQGKDAVVLIGGVYPAVNAIQNFDWEPRFNEENLQELGNADYAAQTTTPEVSGSFDMTATGSTVALLKRMIQTLTADEYSGPMAGDPSTADNAGLIKSEDLEFAVFDVIEAKKANEAFERSTALLRMGLSSFNMRADANGNASESYQFEGDLARIFPKAKRDVSVVPCTRVGASTTAMSVQFTAFDNIGLSGSVTADFIVQYAMIDEVLVPATAITIGTPGGGLFSFQAPYEVKQGQRVTLVVYRRVPGAFPVIQYPTSARHVKANQADIFLVPCLADGGPNLEGMTASQLNAYAFSNADRFLRAQSFDLNVDMRREALRQIAKTDTGNAVFYRGAQYPLNVTASINVLETTMADHAKLSGKNAATDILDLESFQGKYWQIVARYYVDGETLQTTAFTNAAVNGSGRRVGAGSKAEIAWSFTGSRVIIAGEDI